MNINHVFTCVHCGRNWTVVSDARLDCFFSGLCCDCIQKYKIKKEAIERALNPLCAMAERAASNLFNDPFLETDPEKITKEEKRAAAKAQSAQVTEVFEYWKATCGHQNAFLDEKRSNAISRQLAAGRTPEELKLAIDGAADDPFLQGSNSNGRRYDDIGLILRDAAHVERYMEASRKAQRERATLSSGIEGAEQYEDIFERLRREQEERNGEA